MQKFFKWSCCPSMYKEKNYTHLERIMKTRKITVTKISLNSQISFRFAGGLGWVKLKSHNIKWNIFFVEFERISEEKNIPNIKTNLFTSNSFFLKYHLQWWTYIGTQMKSVWFEKMVSIAVTKNCRIRRKYPIYSQKLLFLSYEKKIRLRGGKLSSIIFTF